MIDTKAKIRATCDVPGCRNEIKIPLGTTHFTGHDLAYVIDGEDIRRELGAMNWLIGNPEAGPEGWDTYCSDHRDRGLPTK